MNAHGVKATLRIDTNADTLTAITSYLTEIRIDQEAKTVFRTIPGLQETYEIGQTTGAFLLEGVLDAAIITHLQGLWDSNANRDALWDFEYGPQGNTTGLPKLTGKFRLATFHIGTTIDDAGRWQATLQITDAVVTVATFA